MDDKIPFEVMPTEARNIVDSIDNVLEWKPSKLEMEHQDELIKYLNEMSIK